MDKTIDIRTNIPNYVDHLEKNFDLVKGFLQSDEVLNSFPKPKPVRHNDWGDIQKTIEEKYGPVASTYGKCFHSAKFLQHFAGGRKHVDLKLIRPFVFCDLGIKTTHWFIREKVEPRRIFDTTDNQFTYKGYTRKNLDHLWEEAKNGEFGNPYFKRGGLRYDECVPGKFHLELWDMFKAKYPDVECGFSWWEKQDQNAMKEEQNKDTLVPFFL